MKERDSINKLEIFTDMVEEESQQMEIVQPDSAGQPTGDGGKSDKSSKFEFQASREAKKSKRRSQGRALWRLNCASRENIGKNKGESSKQGGLLYAQERS